MIHLLVQQKHNIIAAERELGFRHLKKRREFNRALRQLRSGGGSSLSLNMLQFTDPMGTWFTAYLKHMEPGPTFRDALDKLSTMFSNRMTVNNLYMIMYILLCQIRMIWWDVTINDIDSPDPTKLPHAAYVEWMQAVLKAKPPLLPVRPANNDIVVKCTKIRKLEYTFEVVQCDNDKDKDWPMYRFWQEVDADAPALISCSSAEGHKVLKRTTSKHKYKYLVYKEFTVQEIPDVQCIIKDSQDVCKFICTDHFKDQDDDRIQTNLYYKISLNKDNTTTSYKQKDLLLTPTSPPQSHPCLQHYKDSWVRALDLIASLKMENSSNVIAHIAPLFPGVRVDGLTLPRRKLDCCQYVVDMCVDMVHLFINKQQMEEVANTLPIHIFATDKSNLYIHNLSLALTLKLYKLFPSPLTYHYRVPKLPPLQTPDNQSECILSFDVSSKYALWVVPMGEKVTTNMTKVQKYHIQSIVRNTAKHRFKVSRRVIEHFYKRIVHIDQQQLTYRAYSDKKTTKSMEVCGVPTKFYKMHVESARSLPPGIGTYLDANTNKLYVCTSVQLNSKWIPTPHPAIWSVPDEWYEHEHSTIQNVKNVSQKLQAAANITKLSPNLSQKLFSIKALGSSLAPSS